MIPWRNFPKMSRETIVAGTVLDLSKSFKYCNNIPNLNLRGESCD